MMLDILLIVSMNRIGLLVPSSNTTMEPDCYAMAPPGVTVHTARMFLRDVTTESLEMMAEEATRAAKLLETADIDVLIYGCTSGSLIKGREWEARLANSIQARALTSERVINYMMNLHNMIKALVLYHSQQYGNTERMANAVAEGLREAGCSVTLHNTNKQRYPIEEYGDYDLVALGTPDYFSYMAGTLKTFLDDWYLHRNQPGYKGKPYVLFMSHGGGGRAMETLSVFRYLGTHVGETVSSNGSPSEAILRKCRELGVLLTEKA